jgi:hypothetical protein
VKKCEVKRQRPCHRPGHATDTLFFTLRLTLFDLNKQQKIKGRKDKMPDGCHCQIMTLAKLKDTN